MITRSATTATKKQLGREQKVRAHHAGSHLTSSLRFSQRWMYATPSPLLKLDQGRHRPTIHQGNHPCSLDTLNEAGYVGPFGAKGSWFGASNVPGVRLWSLAVISFLEGEIPEFGAQGLICSPRGPPRGFTECSTDCESRCG